MTSSIRRTALAERAASGAINPISNSCSSPSPRKDHVELSSAQNITQANPYPTRESDGDRRRFAKNRNCCGSDSLSVVARNLCKGGLDEGSSGQLPRRQHLHGQ